MFKYGNIMFRNYMRFLMERIIFYLIEKLYVLKFFDKLLVYIMKIFGF